MNKLTKVSVVVVLTIGIIIGAIIIYRSQVNQIIQMNQSNETDQKILQDTLKLSKDGKTINSESFGAGLQTAVHYGNTDAAKLMVQVIRLHYLADEILFRELMYLCEKKGEYSYNRDRLEEGVWKRLADSPDRVRLLQKANRLEKRAIGETGDSPL